MGDVADLRVVGWILHRCEGAGWRRGISRRREAGRFGERLPAARAPDAGRGTVLVLGCGLDGPARLWPKHLSDATDLEHDGREHQREKDSLHVLRLDHDEDVNRPYEAATIRP